MNKYLMAIKSLVDIALDDYAGDVFYFDLDNDYRGFNEEYKKLFGKPYYSEETLLEIENGSDDEEENDDDFED